VLPGIVVDVVRPFLVCKQESMKLPRSRDYAACAMAIRRFCRQAFARARAFYRHPNRTSRG
jgi:hypothetical protein